MGNCENCAYYSSMEETCCRRESKNYMRDVSPKSGCSKFEEENTKEHCLNCRWCSYDENMDMICNCSDSDYWGDYVAEESVCDEWENE